MIWIPEHSLTQLVLSFQSFSDTSQSFRWNIWIFMSCRDTLIRWIMLHGSQSRTLMSKLITSSATRSKCSVSITIGINVIAWPGDGTDHWEMADEMHTLWPLFQEKVQTIKSQFEYRCDIFYMYKVHTKYKKIHIYAWRIQMVNLPSSNLHASAITMCGNQGK